MSNIVEVWVAKGLDTITGLTSAKTVDTSTRRGVNFIHVQPIGANVRYRDDGTAPTSTTGMRLVNGGIYEYRGNIGDLQFIEESATATLIVKFYG